jgi:hypothetical protein
MRKEVNTNKVLLGPWYGEDDACACLKQLHYVSKRTCAINEKSASNAPELVHQTHTSRRHHDTKRYLALAGRKQIPSKSKLPSLATSNTDVTKVSRNQK